jgi:hypothetical protein
MLILAIPIQEQARSALPFTGAVVDDLGRFENRIKIFGKPTSSLSVPAFVSLCRGGSTNSIDTSCPLGFRESRTLDDQCQALWLCLFENYFSSGAYRTPIKLASVVHADLRFPS